MENIPKFERSTSAPSRRWRLSQTYRGGRMNFRRSHHRCSLQNVSNGATVTTLIDLAKAEFGRLLTAECLLLDRVQTGDVAQLNTGLNYSTAAIGANPTGPGRQIRAAVLRWLCVSEEAQRRVDPKGIRVNAAHVTGRLDLDGTTPGFPLVLSECSVADGISLRYANFIYLSLEDCEIGTFDADYLVTRGSLRLTGSSCRGHVYLRGAQIGGNLRCARVSITTILPEKVALDAAFSSVAGAVVLNDQFRAEGMVNLYCIRIAKNLLCEGGTFIASRYRDPAIPRSAREWAALQDDVALYLEGAVVDGSVYMRSRAGWVTGETKMKKPEKPAGRHFRMLGQARLFNTVIHGALECDGARMACISSQPLYIENCQIDKALLLRTGFLAVGGVRVRATSIGAALDLSRSHLRGFRRQALDASFIRVGIACVLNAMRATGGINLEFAEIGANLTFGEGCRFDGHVNVYGVAIGGSIAILGAAIKPAKGHTGWALNLERARVEGGVFLREWIEGVGSEKDAAGPNGTNKSMSVHLFEAFGGINLVGARIAGDLVLSGAQLKGAQGVALNMRSITVGRNVIFAPSRAQDPLIPCRLDGEVNAYQATIGGDLTCTGALMRNSGKVSLNLNWAKVAGVTRLDSLPMANGDRLRFSTSGTVCMENASLARIADDPECWPEPGNLVLDGLTYNAITQVDVKKRQDWLQRQQHTSRVPLQPYERLALVLRQSGREDDAREVAIAKCIANLIIPKIK